MDFQGIRGTVPSLPQQTNHTADDKELPLKGLSPLNPREESNLALDSKQWKTIITKENDNEKKLTSLLSQVREFDRKGQNFKSIEIYKENSEFLDSLTPTDSNIATLYEILVISNQFHKASEILRISPNYESVAVLVTFDILNREIRSSTLKSGASLEQIKQIFEEYDRGSEELMSIARKIVKASTQNLP